MRFPSQKLPEMADAGEALPLAESHPMGMACPANPGYPPDAVVARVIGRALDAQGQPVADTTRQENYAEDRFVISPALQETLSRAAAHAGEGRFPLPKELAQLWVTYAYLGQLDVRPCENPVGVRPERNQSTFWAQRVSGGGNLLRLRVEGRSDVMSRADQLMGRTYRHGVRLAWEGFLELKSGRLTRLLLFARGEETLMWREEHALAATADPKNPVAFLPAGRPLDFTRRVRYGILGESVSTGARKDQKKVE